MFLCTNTSRIDRQLGRVTFPELLPGATRKLEADVGLRPLTSVFSFCSLWIVGRFCFLEFLMAVGLTLNLSASYLDANDVVGEVEVAGLVLTLAVEKLVHCTQTVGTVEEVIEIGDIVSRGSCILVNLDPTNYIEVKVGTGGAIFAKLFPKDSVAGASFCFVHLGSGAQSPFVIANSAACEMQIFLTPL